MADIKTKISVGNTVWWVHCTGRVYKGVVEDIHICEYQGALYCLIHSPSFKRNQYPVVHYSNVFLDKERARGFAKYQIRNPDNVLPMCMGCHYNAYKEKGVSSNG